MNAGRSLCIGFVLLAACAAVRGVADPDSDAPEAPVAANVRYKDVPTYADALRVWTDAEDVGDWIGARFRYDTTRAVQLSETQRRKNGRLPIHEPAAFFAEPSGVCVDVARFGVETLRVIAPQQRARYLMIEFDPTMLKGNTLRRHWLATFERDGRHYFFADSKRPGHVAGPYASTGAFVAEYATYRGRRVVSFSELESYERQVRAPATRQERAPVR